MKIKILLIYQFCVPNLIFVIWIFWKSLLDNLFFALEKLIEVICINYFLGIYSYR